MTQIDINDFSKFELKITPTTKNRVGRLYLSIPYTYSEIYEELERENWQSMSEIHQLGIDLWLGKRLKCRIPAYNNYKLQHIQRYFKSEKVKREFIKFLYEITPNLLVNWDFTQDDMFNHTHFHGELTKDLPGFECNLHTDYRRLVGTGLIHWSEYDDPDLRTVFYNDCDRSNPIEMTTNFGDGWIHANGNDTWHDGWNRTKKNRYSTLLALTANVRPINQ